MSETNNQPLLECVIDQVSRMRKALEIIDDALEELTTRVSIEHEAAHRQTTQSEVDDE